MNQGYRPNVPIPDSNDQLFSQMKASIVEIWGSYLSRHKQGQIIFFAKDGAIRTFFKPTEIEIVNEYDEDPGGLSREGLISMLNSLKTSLKKRETILYADLIIDYESDEDGGLAYLTLNIRTQEHFT